MYSIPFTSVPFNWSINRMFLRSDSNSSLPGKKCASICSKVFCLCVCVLMKIIAQSRAFIISFFPNWTGGMSRSTYILCVDWVYLAQFTSSVPNFPFSFCCSLFPDVWLFYFILFYFSSQLNACNQSDDQYFHPASAKKNGKLKLSWSICTVVYTVVVQQYVVLCMYMYGFTYLCIFRHSYIH